MKYADSFKSTSSCRLSSHLKLKDMRPEETTMATYFPYHFYDNLDLRDQSQVLLFCVKILKKFKWNWYSAVLADLVDFKSLGGGTVCEVSSSGYNRDPGLSSVLINFDQTLFTTELWSEKVADLSRRSKVKIVMGTSYYTENMDIDNASVEEVATFIQSELQNGIHQN